VLIRTSNYGGRICREPECCALRREMSRRYLVLPGACLNTDRLHQNTSTDKLSQRLLHFRWTFGVAALVILARDPWPKLALGCVVGVFKRPTRKLSDGIFRDMVAVAVGVGTNVNNAYACSFQMSWMRVRRPKHKEHFHLFQSYHPNSRFHLIYFFGFFRIKIFLFSK